ncbi:MAG: hypothetical protein J6A92_01140 [Lachnospiraceae bacterium]|nr:hypothetical protein [Lachnospiraceae bacterium]
MRLKYYLRGIGIGVFFTTIIFMISISMHKEEFVQTVPETEEVAAGTVADLQESILEEEVPETETSKEILENTETESADSENIEDTEIENVSTESTETEALETEGETEKELEESEDSNTGSVTIQVEAGEFSDQVCVKLREAGLVEDAWDFNVYLMGIDYDNLIRPGTYDIPVGASYEEIADVLVPWKKAAETSE